MRRTQFLPQILNIVAAEENLSTLSKKTALNIVCSYYVLFAPKQNCISQPIIHIFIKNTNVSLVFRRVEIIDPSLVRFTFSCE